MNQGQASVAMGERLRKVRQQRQLSQETLARRAMLALSTIIRIERGQRSAHPETIQRLASALDISPQWLMRGDDNDRQEV